MPNDKTTQELGHEHRADAGERQAGDGRRRLVGAVVALQDQGPTWYRRIAQDQDACHQLQAHLHSALAATKNPDAAWNWVRFLSTPYYQTQFCKIGLWLPSQTALMTEEGLKTLDHHGRAPRRLRRHRDEVCAAVWQGAVHAARLPKVDKVLGPAWDKIRAGEGTAADVLKSAVPEANAILAEEIKKS